MGHIHLTITARLTTSLTPWETRFFQVPQREIEPETPIYQAMSLRLFWMKSPSCSLPYLRPGTLSDRSIFTRTLFHCISISKENLSSEVPDQLQLTLPSGQEKSHAVLCFTMCNFKPTPKGCCKDPWLKMRSSCDAHFLACYNAK